jgi:hypothetical protein
MCIDTCLICDMFEVSSAACGPVGRKESFCHERGRQNLVTAGFLVPLSPSVLHSVTHYNWYDTR